jgi:hypothetical protein
MASVRQWRLGLAAAGIAVAAANSLFLAPLVPDRLGGPLATMVWMVAGYAALRALTEQAIGRTIERG